MWTVSHSRGDSTLFLCKASKFKLILSFNYWLYDFNDTRFQKKIKKNLDIFVLLVTFENLSHYPNIDSSHYLKEDIQWITDINFMKNIFGLNGFDTFFLHFSIEFLVFAFFCFCSNSHKTYCDVLMITYAWQTSIYSHRDIFERIYWRLFRWKLMNLMAVKIKIIFRNFFWTLTNPKHFFVNC